MIVTTEVGYSGLQLTRRIITWPRFVDSFRTPLRPRPKHLMPGWSPACFRGNRKTIDNIESVSSIVLDYDKCVTTPLQASVFWRLAKGIVHTTSSHTETNPRFRVVLALGRPVTSYEYSRLWQVVYSVASSSGHIVEASAGNPNKFWRAPMTIPDYRMYELVGRPIEVDRVLGAIVELDSEETSLEELQCDLFIHRLEKARRYVDRVPAAVSGEGGHSVTYSVAVALTRGFVLSEDDAYDALSRYNDRCLPRWSERDLKYKLRSAVTNSKKPWGYKLGHKE